jgi:membrane protein DedA with SNARE-associated domain
VLAALTDLVTEQIARYGYLAIFLLMLLGSACIPIPSEVVMLFGGAIASAGFAEEVLSGPEHHVGLVAVMVVGVIGSLIGSWLAYWAGAVGGRPLIDRWGRYLLLRPHEVDRAHDWFERHGQGAVFFARLIPLVRAFISLPAGVARMNFSRFTVYTLLGIVPWTVGLALAGYALGENWKVVERVALPLSIVVGIVTLAALGRWIVRRRRALRAEAAPADPPAEQERIEG